MLQYSTACINPEDSWKGAYWGNNLFNYKAGASGTKLQMSGPIRGNGWLQLIVKASDIGLGGQNIQSIGYALAGGAAQWDLSGVGDSNTGGIRVEHLGAYQYVRLYGEDGWTVLASAQADADGVAFLDLYGSSSKISAFPIAGRLRVYTGTGPGSETQYFSPTRYPLWGGDVWSFNQAEPFERNDVEVHIHDRLAGITSWDDGREGVLLDMETRTLTTPMKLVDLSGYGHHATVTGASTFSMGKGSGKALSFDGNGDDVSIPQTEYSVSTSTFSAALWVRPEQLQSTTPINVISWGDPTSTTWAWYIELLPTTSNNYFHVVAHAASSTTSVTLQVNNAVRKSTEWTHLALVYDGHTVVLFINGAPTASSPQEGLTLRNPSAAITIGKKFVGGTTIENYAGLIDELRIYRRPLTEEPVLQLFLLERTPAKKTFIGYDVYGSPILRKTEWVSTLWQDVDWLTESFGYDGYRNLATYVNPAGQTTYLDQTTNPSETYLKETRTTVGSGPQIKHQWTYDAWGRVATTTTPEGYVTDYGYDVVGRITSILYPANTQGAALRPAEYWVYVDSDRRIEYTAPSGWVLKSYYDGLGRVQRTARHFPDNGWEHTDYWYYNFQDRVFKEKDKDSNGVIFTYSYDTFGRLLKEEGPWSNPSRIDIRKFEYSDSLGRVRFKDGEGKVTDTYSDRYGRTTATCQWPASQPGASDDCLTGTSLSFVKMAIERDLSGQPKRWIDAGGNPRRWNYNQLGEVSREWYADGTSVRHSSYIDTTSHTWIDYDCEGTSVISQTYSDGLRRPTTVDYIAGNAEDETYTYDRDSRITTAGNSHFRYSYIYNSWNQVINKEIWYDRDLAQTYTKNVGMTYDEFMRLSDVTYPDGVKILYKYSAAAVPPAQPPSAGSNLDRVLSVKAVWAPGQAEVDLVTSFAYNQRDQPVSEVRKASNANLDVAVGYQYDDYGRLTYHTIGLPAPNSFQWTYAYGKNGDTVQDRGSDITYDGLGRMILADVGGPDRTWTYDNNGNRLTQNNGDTHTYTYNYGAGDRLLDYTWKDSGTPIYKLQYYYDAGGRVTEAREATYCGGACNSYFYAYDEAGRLSKASYGATIPTAVTKGEYKYGPDGELLKSVEQGATKYNFPVSGNVVYTFVPNGETRDYFFANGDLKALRVVNGGTTNYIVYADWQYNIRLITDTSDQKKWEGSYYPFGATLVTTSDISNSFTFAGNNERGNIHLNFFHARWYDSSTGRFLSRDPQERGAWHTQNANLYAYPYNAPNTLVDKSGESPHLLVAGAVGLGAAIGTGLACWWMGHDDCWNKAAIAGVGAFAFVATLGMSSVLFAGFGAAGTVAGFAIAGTASAYVSMTADMALTGHEYTAQEFAGGLVLGAATGALLGGLGAAAARPLSRVATRLGFGPGAPGAGRRIALMGEDMAQVKAAAADLRARGTHVEMMADLPESAFNGYRMNINRYWIRQLMREDVEIWDLGRAPWIEQEGARLRPYYAMELQETYGYWNSWWVQ